MVSLDFPGAPNYEELDGVKVYRAPSEIGHPHFLTWTLLFNNSIEKRVADVGVDFDVLHVHDWLTALLGLLLSIFCVSLWWLRFTALSMAGVLCIVWTRLLLMVWSGGVLMRRTSSS